MSPETVFRFGRIQDNSDWFLPCVVVILFLYYIVRRYRRDAVDLRFWQRWLLGVMRIAVLVALFGYFLAPRWEHLVGTSRVAILIDTSASMANRDLFTSLEKKYETVIDNAGNTNSGKVANEVGPTRLAAAVDWLERSDLIKRLCEKHDVVVYKFDQSLERILLEEHGNGTAATPRAVADNNRDSNANTNTEIDNSTEPQNPLSALTANGEQTRLGETLYDLIQRERSEPVSGIVLISDGGQNAGAGIDAAIEAASRANLPIFTLGIGALRQPLNFRAVSIDTAERAFAGDPFIVRTQVEMVGGEGAAAVTVKLPIELYIQDGSGGSDNVGNNSGTKVGEKTIELTPGGSVVSEFEIRNEDIGKHKLVLRIVPPPDDTNDADNATEAELEIVDHKDRILLYASGPSRDYQFLLAQIARDKGMQVDVYLPWAAANVTHSADERLMHFPDNATEMAKYDCVIAFDPNWSELGDTEIDTLEHWVARQGGGLIAVAGQINIVDSITGWVTDSRTAKIRAMYPVDVHAKLSVGEQRYHSQAQPMPLKFTRAGDDAEYLRPLDSDAESRAVWSEFSGFYAVNIVKGVKPTASLLAEVDTTSLGISGAAVVFAEQFYGAGHVLYLGSGEVWRLRRLEPAYFEKLYTKMIRHVSQGRLQRESDRGSLATDKRRYSLGGIAALRVVANDEQLKPLTLPKLPIEVRTPSGKITQHELTLDPVVPGAYLGHLPMTEEGAWSFTLAFTGSQDKIERTVQVQMSDLERENPSRNEPLLRELAEKSGGQYYQSLGIAAAPQRESGLYGNLFTDDRGKTIDSPPELFDLLKIRSQRAVLDADAEKNMATIFLYVIASLLLVEWTFRRLFQLA
ncbi:MAG: hypothetical protein LBU65_04955 [Planctomycetaceae bacterium]|jgi:hypothetical protein|nr:hypothetical protein [Planctomycetaceae bacterium]